MKKMIFSIIFAFMTLTSYGLPYQENGQIQLYTNISDSLLSSGAKKCLKESSQKGVMTQLSQSLGCSSFVTAEKVCRCVESLFDKDKVLEFYSSATMTTLGEQLKLSTTLEESSLEPEFHVAKELGDINMIYNEMGLEGCSLGGIDPFFKKMDEPYSRRNDKFNKSNEAIHEDLNRQHQIFNREFSKLSSKKPSDEELIKISKIVSEESKSTFFLEARLKQKFDLTKSNESAYSDIQNEVISEYLSLHRNEIEKNVKSEAFNIEDASSRLRESKGSRGCNKILSFVTEKKEEVLNKKILENFSTFHPDSYLERTADGDRSSRMKTVQSSISGLYSAIAMSGAQEHEKDIFYCRMYNSFKERSADVANNERLKIRLAELEMLKKEDYLNALAGSSGPNDKNVKRVESQIEDLENLIISEFNISRQGLPYALMGYNIWKVDKGLQARTDENGNIEFVTSSSSELTITEKMNNRSRSIEKARGRGGVNPKSSFLTNFNRDSSGKVQATSVSQPSNISKSAKVESSVAPLQNRNTKQDNFFNQVRSRDDFNESRNSFSNSRNIVGRSKDASQSNEDIFESYITERLQKLEKDKISTEKAISDELASTKESLELAKLREELRKQSDEIAKLTKKRDDTSSGEAVASSVSNSAAPTFKSPLASALDSSLMNNASDNGSSRALEGPSSRNTASDSGYTAASSESAVNPSQGSSGSASAASSASASSSDDNSSISGISLSSLKTIGDDVQIIEGFNFGVGKPIVVDASFIELSEDEKRARIEELLNETDEEEVFIEFPDGKVLKFSKKDSKDNKKKVTDKVDSKENPAKKEKRNIFSYDSLKEIIDSSKD